MRSARGWKVAARAVASAAMLAWLIPRIDLWQLIPTWRPRTFAWLGAAMAVTFVGIVLSAMRWQRVLAALEHPARLPTLLSHYLASLFVGNFLPSTVGGDVLRVSRLSSANNSTPVSFASVVLERLTGWLVLPMLTLGAMAVNPGLRQLGTASDLAFTVALVTLGLLCVLLAAAAHPQLGGKLSRNEGWMRFTGAIHVGLDQFRRRPAMLLEVLTVGVAYQLTVMMAAFLAANALGIDIGWTAVLAFMPAVAILQVLPFSVGGLGIREFALVVFLHPLGVSSEQAIAFGLVVYGINLVVSLLGAPAFAYRSRTVSARV